MGDKIPLVSFESQSRGLPFEADEGAFKSSMIGGLPPEADEIPSLPSLIGRHSILCKPVGVVNRPTCLIFYKTKHKLYLNNAGQ